MSDTKTVLEQIKDEYAREKNWDSFDEMTAIYIGVHGVKKGAELISKATDEIATRYATACCKATLEKAGHNATAQYEDPEWAVGMEVNYESVVSPDNIVLL